MASLIKLQKEHGRSKLYIFALWFVGQSSSNHSAFEGEIVSYKIDEKHLQKGMFVKVENFGIESKSKWSFEKDDMCMLSLNMYLINSKLKS
jgi:hypothetical protein